MDGTRYVDGVLVDTTQLSRTENSKAFHILRDRLDNWEAGAHSGLQVTVNAVNTSRVDLSAGVGYAPNGEYVEVLADQLNIQLADIALGAVNWVIVFYTETKTSPNPHETNGTIQPTENQRGVRVRVLTPSDFTLLPLTDPTFASDAQDRALLVGVVTGTGGALTSSNIDQPLAWRSVKHAIMATPPLSGVSIYKVSDETPEGATGAIKLDLAPTRLSWQAPTEAGFGPTVTIVADGTYTLTAIGGSTIQVVVTVAGLPVATTQVTVAVRGLYTQDVPRMSSTDRHHRSLLGTGVPSPSNPHGLSLDDITPGFATDITLHQQLMHANGIWRGSLATCLSVSIDETPNPDRLLITAPAGNDCYWVHGRRLTAIQNTVLEFTDPMLPANRGVFEIVVNNAGGVAYLHRLDHTGTNLTTNPDTGVVWLNDEVLDGVHTITWWSLGAGAGGYLAWDNSATPVHVPDGAYGLYRLLNGKQEVWFYVAAEADLPAAAGFYTDNVTVLAKADRDENLVLAQVWWGGNSVGTLGYTPARGAKAALLRDLRLFGTLTEFHMRDDALRDIIEYPMDEHYPSGVAIGRLDSQSAYGSLWTEKPAAGLTLTIWGQAPVYVRGRRHVVGSFTSPLTVTVNDNDVTVVYIDIHGNVKTCPALLAGFLLLNSPNAFDSVEYYKTLAAEYATSAWVYTGTPLALVTSFGGNVTHVVDMRRNLSGGNVHVRPWTVGSIIPALLTNAYQAVEFYSIDAAIVYALVQGQEKIECSYAVLTNPTFVFPYQVPAGKNLSLSGSLVIDGNWSLSTTVFELGNGANMHLEGLKIAQGSSFVGSASLVLVQTSALATASSMISISNSEVDWVGCGHLVDLVSGGPLSCVVSLDDVAVACSGGGAPALVRTHVSSTPIQLSGVSIKSGSPVALAETDSAMSVVASGCYGTVGTAMVSVIAPGVAFGTFTSMLGFESPKVGTGAMINSTWTACWFVGPFSVDGLSNCAWSGCTVAGAATFGSVAAKLASLSFAGCTATGGWTIYADDVQMSACAGQSLMFGGNDFSVSASKFQGDVIHAGHATNNANFAGCVFDDFIHSSTVDLTNWHITASSLAGVFLRWSTEELHDFSVVGCSLTSAVCRPVAPQPAKALNGTVDNCSFDLSSGASNAQFAYCSAVRIRNCKFRGIAQQSTPMLLLGQGVGVGAQEMYDIKVEGNDFEVLDVVMGSPDIGPPVILIANENSPILSGIGIVVARNTFRWQSASASDVTKLVTCLVWVANAMEGYVIDGNTALLIGNANDVVWDTDDGACNAMRMALAFFWRDLATANHTLVNLAKGRVSNNLLTGEALGGGPPTRWICWDAHPVGSIAGIMQMGNMGGVNNMRLNPHNASGVPAVDAVLNFQVDNTVP